MGELRLAQGAGLLLSPVWVGLVLAEGEAVDPLVSPALLRRLAGRTVGEASARVSQTESRLRPYAETERFLERQGQLDRPVNGRVRFGYGPVARTTSNTAHRHTGVTYRLSPAGEVRSVARGIVSFAAAFSDYGGVVVIDHGSGFHTVYALLDSIFVEPGQPVSTGRRLGNARDSARADIYFEIRYRGRPLDPADWIRGAR
jgi:septal ring factor EnvC (AmiA/AmiB activator)